MTPSTEEQLTDLFAASIREITPRIAYKGAETWKVHARPDAAPTTTRRCRLIWAAGNVQPRGARAGDAIETFASLRIQTDYVGEVSKMQFAIADDLHQLGDTLAGLRGPDNGLITVERVRTVPVMGRPGTDDAVRVDHVFNVRFIRRIQL